MHDTKETKTRRNKRIVPGTWDHYIFLISSGYARSDHEQNWIEWLRRRLRAGEAGQNQTPVTEQFKQIGFLSEGDSRDV